MSKTAVVREAFGSPRRAAHTLRSNPVHVSSVALLGGGVAAQAPALERRRTPEQRRRADKATGAVVGGAAGQAAWLSTGYEIRRRGHMVERERPEWMNRSQHQKLMRAHARAAGVKQNTKPDAAHAPNFYRTYPLGMPATKYKRRLGHMSGPKGALKNAAVVGAGALVGAGTVRGRKQDREVSKGLLYQREQRISPARTLEFAAGAGLGAWGLGRSRMVGRALGRGIKMASGHNNAKAIEALQMAQAAQGVLRRGTAPGERALRQVRRIDQAVRAVPAPMRPEIALAAGTLLAGNSMPLRSTTYKPIPMSYPTVRQVW